MGKMLDNARAWWNSLADNLSDPGKLAMLSVADLEKGIKRAKEAAAPVIGRPSMLESKLKQLKASDSELTDKITALIKAGSEGQEAARKYVERQIVVRKDISDTEAEYIDAREAADMWQSKIRVLENELYTRRNKADRMQAEYETAKAEQQLGKQMQNVDSLMGADSFSSLQARVEKEKAKAAGYSQMSGLSDHVKEEELLRNTQTDALLKEYLDKAGN